MVTKHPDYAGDALIERICELAHQIIFRLPWGDDSGPVQVSDNALRPHSLGDPYEARDVGA